MEELIKILESKGIRPTAMRLLVLNRFADSEVALSIGELEKDFQNSERSTLFRTIKTFGEKGIVHKIEDGTGIMKYFLCQENCECEIGSDLHLHFHCNSCDETVCLTEQKIPHITLPAGFEATDANLVITGICSKCNVGSS